MKARLIWLIAYTCILAFFVGVGPFVGWYAHLVWRTVSYGWNA